MPREDLTLAVSQGFQTNDAPPDAFYAEKRAWYMDVQGASDSSPAFQIRRVSPTTGARTVLFTVTKSGDVNFTNTTFEAGDGTSIAPSYTFSSETTLGLYRAGAGILGIAGSPRIANQTIFYGRNAANNGDVQVLYVDAADQVALQGGAVRIGLGYLAIVTSNPATAGILRVPNNTDLTARNAADTANLRMVGVTSTNDTAIGESGQIVIFRSDALAVGLNPASAGVIRIPNNSQIIGRNAANNGDINLGYINATNLAVIGGSGGVIIQGAFASIGTTPAAGGTIRLPNNNSIRWRNAGDTGDLLAYYDNNDTFVIPSGNLAVGVTPASAGIIRIPNNTVLTARNAANNANVNLISVDGSDIIHIAENGQQVAIHGNIVAAVSFFSIGTTPATSGVIRIPSGSSISSRNNANTANIALATLNASDIWDLGGGNLINFNYAVTALGGGAAPTFGTIGGSGPAAAAQNSWLRVFIGGTSSFLPVWR